MKLTRDSSAVGAVCSKGDPRRAALQAHAGGLSEGEVAWFDPAALHELDRAVRKGQIRRVVFADLSGLLRGIWDEEIEYRQWPGSVQIEFLEAGADRKVIDALVTAWEQWRPHHRRRQAVAGAILSAVVLGLSFLLCVLLAR